MNANYPEPVMLFVLLTFATYRVSRFIALDAFPPMKALRRAIGFRKITIRSHGRPTEVHYIERKFLMELVNCPHCVSVYVAGILTLIMWSLVGMVVPGLWWLGIAGGSSVLSSLTSED